MGPPFAFAGCSWPAAIREQWFVPCLATAAWACLDDYSNLPGHKLPRATSLANDLRATT
uniref:Uncharacterized protein n=1 Tax=Oryza sativa subsp. japonica TaxID=39947 RepID=Q651J3_ORYSJ|nr:hypothetical protein [Oryza sativa Japonica Group]